MINSRPVTRRRCNSVRQPAPPVCSDIRRSIVATEFGADRDPDVVEHIFSSLRNVLRLPVQGYDRSTSMPAVLHSCVL